MIRVLHVVAGMDCGGIENFIMNLYKKIDREKIQFDFLYHTSNRCFFDEEIIKLGGQIYRFPMSERVNFFKYFKFLDAFFKNTDYKIIHSHYSMFGVFYNYFAKKHNVEFRIGHAHTTSFLGKGLNGLADRILTPMYNFGLTNRLACSKAAGKFMFKSKSFKVFPNGIDTDKFLFNKENRKQIRQAYNIDEDSLVLGCVGQLRQEKNQIWLIKLISEIKSTYPNIFLLLVGDGKEKENINQEIEKYNVKDNVILAGIQSEPEKFYSAFDIFLLPSIFEGLPICTVEAQANGLYCLVSTGVPDDVNLSDKISFLPLSKMEEWIDAINKILKNKEYKRKIELKSSPLYSLDVSVSAEKIQTLYLSLIEGDF